MDRGELRRMLSIAGDVVAKVAPPPVRRAYAKAMDGDPSTVGGSLGALAAAGVAWLAPELGLSLPAELAGPLGALVAGLWASGRFPGQRAGSGAWRPKSVEDKLSRVTDEIVHADCGPDHPEEQP